MSTENKDEVHIGEYLLERLAQLGVTKMFGVPGDFNLGFLDLVEDHKTIGWVGNCNELNASYAADGYARVKEKSLGVLCTTFGVGELSAMNGIAGAFSEHVPVLHIAGVPSTPQLKSKPMLHHTLGDGRFDAYTKAAEQVTHTQAALMNKLTAAAEIDRVLVDCIRSAKPVYLTLPTDIVYCKTSRTPLLTPLTTAHPPNDPDAEAYVLDEIAQAVRAAEGDVVILVDACAVRHHVREEVRELLERTGFPVYAAPMGKTSVREGWERYGGMYVGSLSHEPNKTRVESAKLILSIGALKSDFNTGNFTYRIPQSHTIELHSTHTQIRYAMYPGIGMKPLLPKLTVRLAEWRSVAEKIMVTPFASMTQEEVVTAPGPAEGGDGQASTTEKKLAEGEVIHHDWFWPRIGKFLQRGDVVVSETGTSSFGVLDVVFPDEATLVTQILWGSIGWTVGSTLGAAFASRDLGKNRVLLFVGDGSLQLTVQEISTMIHHGLTPIIFVLNNEGYTIERYLHGPTRKYNDIVNWSWTSLLDTFQSTPNKPNVGKSYTVHSRSELSALLDDERFASAGEIQLVEVMMVKMDAPRALRAQAELSGKMNAYGVSV